MRIWKDFFVGGAKFQKSELFLSKGSTYFKVPGLFNKSVSYEDVDATFFDVDNENHYSAAEAHFQLA